jgi:hypothetical protein
VKEPNVLCASGRFYVPPEVIAYIHQIECDLRGTYTRIAELETTIEYHNLMAEIAKLKKRVFKLEEAALIGRELF